MTNGMYGAPIPDYYYYSNVSEEAQHQHQLKDSGMSSSTGTPPEMKLKRNVCYPYATTLVGDERYSYLRTYSASRGSTTQEYSDIVGDHEPASRPNQDAV